MTIDEKLQDNYNKIRRNNFFFMYARNIDRQGFDRKYI
jgi:hypothetical protein